MSSSSNYHSSQLHRVNRHSNGKRPFEECASGSTSSGNTHHFPTNSSSDTSSGEGRNKRARSTSSSDTDVSSSSDSVSTGYNTAQSSSRSDLGFGGPSVLPANEVDCPVPPVASPPFVAIQDVEMSDLHLGIRPSPPRRNRIPTPAMAEDNLRSSLERFAEFDRQIAALRSSLAATRSPLPPPLGSSGGEDPFVPRDDWAAMSSGFLSGGSTELPASGPNVAGSSNVPVAPSETISSMSTFSSSDGQSNQRPDPLPSANNVHPGTRHSSGSASVTVGPSTSSGTPSVSFSLAYSSIPRYPPYPSYRPSPGGSSSAAAQERSENPISSDSTLPSFMRPASPDVSAPTRFVARPSLSSISSGSTSSSSLLGLNPEPSLPSSPSPPIISDDLSTRYGIVVDELGSVSRGLSARREDGLSRDSLIHSVSPGGEGSSFILGDRRAEQFGSPSQARPDARLRVLRDPLEREAVRSVFDVFGIGESTQERNSLPLVTRLWRVLPPNVHLRVSAKVQGAMRPTPPRPPPLTLVPQNSTPVSIPLPPGLPSHPPTPSCPKAPLNGDMHSHLSGSTRAVLDRAPRLMRSRTDGGRQI
ncbi:hypothetical protein BDN67DRAFT_520002 [Paxillus ammoniavirescens]|nr:hypothetical protein BDN67DRAFT_520002 [Paxillus ammoniavirescens]